MKHFALFLSCLIPFVISGQIMHVPNDYGTIQEGINAANTDDTVLVAPGTYNENISFMGKSITVASNFILPGNDTNYINNTIINAGLNGSAVLFNNNEDTTSVLCGFTIIGGNGTYVSGLDAQLGGGIACHNSGATIKNNKIFDNETKHSYQAAGGGIGALSTNALTWILIENNVIKNNTVTSTGELAEGGGIYAGCNARIINNSIENNQCINETNFAFGGGIEVQKTSGNTCQAILINNTVRNNTINGANTVNGGGILLLFTSFLCIDNNISNNTIEGEEGIGGGITIYGNSGDGEISGNIISNNTVNANFNLGGGLIIYYPETPYNISIKENNISNNSGGAGGGICVVDAENVPIIIYENMFLNNTGISGGGLYTRRCYNLIVSNNIFGYNFATEFGGAIQLYDFQDKGDSQYLSDTINPLLVNNTFAFNNCDNNGGAISCHYFYETPIIFNSIFYENSAMHGNDIYYSGPGEIVVSYSDIDATNNIYISGTGSYTGEGNINEDPQFYLSGDHPFSLSENSPCIDVGSPDTTGLMLLPWDIVRNIRVWDGNDDGDTIIDMGAYEFGAPIWVSIEEEYLLYYVKNLTLFVYPNPFSTSITIEYNLSIFRNAQINIFNHLGQFIKRIHDGNLQLGKQQYVWDASDLPNGIYFVQVRVGQEVATRKVVKMR